MDKEAVNGVATDPEPVQLSFPMPNAPATNIYLHLTVNATSVVLFLSSLAADSGAAAVAMGSFVYAMPNLRNPASQPILTSLYPQTGTLDLANRVATMLARKTKKPVYVGNSINFSSAGLGGTVEEEMEGTRRVIETVARVVQENI